MLDAVLRPLHSMASPIGHVAAALAVAAVSRPSSSVPRGFWWLAALAGALPDIDAIGPILGIPGMGFLGDHRGITHSLAFAILLGGALAVMAARRATTPLPGGAFSPRLWLVFALAAASHGALDALTTYGEGVQLLAPFDWTRLTALWHPLGDPPGEPRAADRGLLDFGNEPLSVWLPSLAVAVGAAVVRRRGQVRQATDGRREAADAR